MNKKVALGVLSLAVLGSVAVASGVFASDTDNAKFGPNYSPERHAQMTEAFTNNDYAAWEKLMDGKNVTSKVTAENFSKFTEMHNLMVAGQTDEANAIRQELGLSNGQGQGHGMNRAGEGQHRNRNLANTK